VNINNFKISLKEFILMTKSELLELKTLLEKELEQIKSDINAFKEVSKPVEPDVSLGRLTRMEAIQSKSINESSLKKAEARQKNIESALRRINKDPDFGICEECDEKIPFKRMLIMPETRLCVKCMTNICG
jgi:DnaK suppressor protein